MNKSGITGVIKGLLVLLLVFSGLFVSTSPAHAAATLSLSPSSGSFGQGQAFTVAVNVNTGGETVNAVEAVLTFPADKLKANFISHSGSGFDINAESTVGSGVVRIAKGKLPPGVVGSRRVASVGFTALSGGTASIGVSGSVLRESDSSNILGGAGGATFNIGAQIVTTTPTDTSPEATKPAVDSQAPKISDVAVLNLGAQTATILWKTDEAADSQVEYGFVTNRVSDEIKYFFTAGSDELVTDHEITLEPKTLIPGYLYHFRISSEDKAGNQAQSEDQIFTVPGYSFELTVTDAQSKAVEGAKVRLPGIGVEAVTDENGQAKFADLPVGDFVILVEKGDQIEESSAKLVADDNKLTVVLGQRIAKPGVALIAQAAGIVILLAIAFLVWWIWKKKRLKLSLPPKNGS